MGTFTDVWKCCGCYIHLGVEARHATCFTVQRTVGTLRTRPAQCAAHGFHWERCLSQPTLRQVSMCLHLEVDSPFNFSLRALIFILILDLIYYRPLFGLHCWLSLHKLTLLLLLFIKIPHIITVGNSSPSIKAIGNVFKPRSITIFNILVSSLLFI